MLTKYYTDRTDLNSFDPFYFLSEFGWPTTHSRNKVNYEVISDEKCLTLTVDLPGVKRNDLQVESNGQSVLIKAKRGKEDLTSTYRISKDYSTENPDAILEDGVLTLKFERRNESKSKVITIR